MRKYTITAVMVFFLAAAGLQAETIKGILTFLDGDIGIHRNGDIDEYSRIPDGLVIRNLDLIMTGSGSRAEISINPGLPGETGIAMSDGTALYFDTVTADGRSGTVIYLLAGDVSIIPGPGASNAQVTLQSRGGAVVESGGNGFEAVTVPDSSTLVITKNSPVICRIASGGSVTADAGSAAEIFQGREIRVIDAGKDNLDLYKNEWIAEKGRLFRSVAFSLTKPVIVEYEDYADRFTIFYKEIRDHDRLIRKYRNGTGGFDAETISADFLELQEDAENMERIIFRFDSLFFHIGDIRKYHDIYPVKGSLHKKYDIDDFMKDYGKSYKSTAKKASFARQVLRIYRMLENSVNQSAVHEG